MENFIKIEKIGEGNCVNEIVTKLHTLALHMLYCTKAFVILHSDSIILFAINSKKKDYVLLYDTLYIIYKIRVQFRHFLDIKNYLYYINLYYINNTALFKYHIM